MNKKLFSWKALAGLALLVAMGLTSCKQDNANIELDENGNYVQPAKPVTPTAKGTTLSGFKTVAELNKLIAGTKDITDNIKAGGNVTITLDCSNLEAAAGDKIIIPSKDDATINLVFANKAKKNGGLVISDDALDVLKITFPSEEMGDFSFVMPYSKFTIASEGATKLGTATFNVNKNDDAALIGTIGKGISIDAFKNWDDTGVWSGRIFIEDGAEVDALVVDAVNNWAGTSANGFDVNRLLTDIENYEEYAVSNLYVTDDATVGCYQYKKKTVADKITIAEGKTVTFPWGGAYVNEVVGLGDKGAIVGNNLQANIPTTFKNVTIDGHDNWYGSSNEPVAATFENCTLVDFNGIYLGQASATGLKFQQDDETTSTSVYYPVYAGASDLSYTYEFSKCEFSTNLNVRAFAEGDNVLDKDGKPIKQTLYEYGWNDPDDDPDQGYIYKNGIEKLTDVPAAIRKGEIGWYNSYLYEPRVYSFDGLELVPSFSECKYDGSDVTEKNIGNFLNYTSLWGADDTEVASTNFVTINDKLYKRIYTKTNGYILVEQ